MGSNELGSMTGNFGEFCDVWIVRTDSYMF